MALNLGDVYFTVNAKTEGLIRASTATRRFADRATRDARRAQRSFENFSKVSVVAIRRFAGALIAYFSLRAGANILKEGDAYRVLQQRIKTATASAGEFLRVRKALIATSTATGTTLESNVSFFQNVITTARELGRSTEDVLRFNETFAQLGVIGGSTADRISGAAFQLSQALAGGVLRAEEYNSLLDNNKEFVNRLSEALGMTVGEFGRAVRAGEILADDVLTGILSISEDINKEFAALEPTLAQANTRLKNVSNVAFNEFNKVITVNETWLKIVSRISDIIEGLDFGVIALRIKQYLFAPFYAVLGLNSSLYAVVYSLAQPLIRLGKIIYEFLIEPFSFVFDIIRDLGTAVYDVYKATVELIGITAIENPFTAFAEASFSKARDNFDFDANFIALQKQREDEAAAAAEELKIINDVTQAKIGAKNTEDELNEETIQGKSYVASVTKQLLSSALLDQNSYFNQLLQMESEHSKEAFEINKGFSIAQATIQGAVAIQAAYTAGVSSAIGPLGIATGVAFALIAAANTAAQIAIIAQTSYSGGRQGGGSVYAGGNYRINESGPEVYSTGGKQYLLTGNSGGTITPNNAIGGGSRVVVNIYPTSGETANVNSRSDGEGGFDIDIVLEKLQDSIAGAVSSGGNNMSQAMEGTYGLSRVGGR